MSAPVDESPDNPDVIFCSNCGEPMVFELSNTDENGKSDSLCYLCRLRKNKMESAMDS